MQFEAVRESVVIGVEGISKSFLSKKVFSNLSFQVRNGDVLGISGPNGSGKSTVLKIAAGLLSFDKGQFSVSIDEKKLNKDSFRNYYGLAAPYAVLYEEFSAFELAKLVLGMRGLKRSEEFIASHLKDFQIKPIKSKEIRACSTGMKQRVLLAIALIHGPIVLFLDEPTSNLDSDGEKLVLNMISDFAKSGGIVILASNSDKELSLSTNRINLLDFK